VTAAAVRRRPLAHLAAEVAADEAPAKAGLVLGERAFLGKLNLRGDGADEGFLGAVETALGFALPVDPNTAEGQGGAVALWLGPDEWLIVTPQGHEAAAAAALAAALAEIHASVVDVSDQRVVITLAGAMARSVLDKGTSLDLEPPAFGPIRCAQTRLARAHVIIHQRDDRPAFDLYVDATFADYLWRWIESAAAEFDPVFREPDDAGG
jgi:sarcosine oxidase subunit gamma